MSLYSVNIIEEPIEFDHSFGYLSITRRETLKKDFWYYHTSLKYMDTIIPILSTEGVFNDEYLRVYYKMEGRCIRLTNIFSVHPYHYSLLKRMLKIK